MLDHVVDEDYIEFLFVLEAIVFKEIAADEIPLGSGFFKETPGIFYLVAEQVQSGHIAAEFGKRKQIASFAASYFQNAAAAVDCFVSPYVIDVIFP